MKKVVILSLAILSLGTNVFASNLEKGPWKIGLSYHVESDFELNSQIITSIPAESLVAGTPFNETGKRSSFELNLGYTQEIDSSVLVDAGFSFISNDIAGTTESLNIGLLTINGKYLFNENIYGFAGINHSLPFNTINRIITGNSGETLTMNTSFKGKIGYQIGIGYRLNNAFSANLSYTNLNFNHELKASGITFANGDTKSSSLTFGGNYHF